MSDSTNIQNVDAGVQSTQAQPAGLEAMLASREYQAPPPGVTVTDDGQIVRDQNGQQTNQSQQVAETRVPQQVPQQNSTPGEAVPQYPPLEVTTPQVGMSEAERRALEDRAAFAERVAAEQGRILQQQALDNARREDEAFEAALLAKVDAGELDPRQAVALTKQRENQKAVRIQTYHAEQNRVRQTQETQRRVDQAKSAVISKIMVMEGIPASYRPLLDQATEPEHLEYTLSLIRPLLQGQPQQQTPYQTQQNVQAIRQELQESGVLNPAGDGAGAPPPEPPKQRSGDLVGLLGSREYQYGSAQ